MNYVTFSELFQYTAMLITFAAFLYTIFKDKK